MFARPPVLGKRGGTPLQMAFRRFVRVATAGAAIALAACTTVQPQQTGSSAAETQSVSGQTELIYDDSGVEEVATAASDVSPGSVRLAPRIVAASRFLQCVPYARLESGVSIRGNAATWWQSAYGIYRQNKLPAPGAVMVFRSSQRNPNGHLAVVRQIVDSRKVVVDHANWLNRGRIHRGTPVVDVSRSNDWSTVRVWYTPGDRLGAHIFPVSGFVHQEKTPPGELFRTVANTNVRRKPSRKAHRVTRLPKLTTIEVLERVTGRPWVRIGQNGRELGYVFTPLVEPIS